MAKSSEVAALLLVAALLQCCRADGYNGGKKKVVIFAPQGVKTIHHHHVSEVHNNHKSNGFGVSKEPQPLFDSWSISGGHENVGMHNFGMSDDYMHRENYWKAQPSNNVGKNVEWAGIQGYIGPPERGTEDHAMQSSNSFDNKGLGDSGSEDVQGTESVRHESRGFADHSTGQGHWNSGRVVSGNRFSFSGHNSNGASFSGFGKGYSGREQGLGAGPSSATGFNSVGVQGLRGDVHNTQGFSVEGSPVFETRIPNLNVIKLGSTQGFGNNFPNSKGYGSGSSQGQTYGPENEGFGFGIRGFGFSNTDSSQKSYSSGSNGDYNEKGYNFGSNGGSTQKDYNPGGHSLRSAIVSNIYSHRGYSLGPSNGLTSGSSNVFRLYNSGGRSGPSSRFQESKGFSFGSGQGFSPSTTISGGRHSLDGYSPDSGYATIRGGYHKELGNGLSTNDYRDDHLSLGSGVPPEISSFDDFSHGGFDVEFDKEPRDVVEAVDWKDWKGVRDGHKGNPTVSYHHGGRVRHTSGLRSSGGDFFGDGDMKAYGSSSRPVTSSRFRSDGRPKKGAQKDSKHRSGFKDESRPRPKRKPVKFPDDEPRNTRNKRHQ